MPEVQIPFPSTSLLDWQQQLFKELKENTNLLQYHSDIEGIQLSLTETDAPQLKPASNATKQWKRLVHIHVSNEKQDNKVLLEGLMQGADAIFIENVNTGTNWQVLFNQIQTAHIDCLIAFEEEAAFTHFKENADQEQQDTCIFLHKVCSTQNFISTFDLQQIGANSATQLASALEELQQILTLNEHPKKIYIELGIGADYFIEIAKLSALKTLIGKFQEIYQTTFEVEFISKTGFCNKSLKDPYTNLLRLSTEALSAAIGGSSYICIQAYDALSTSGASPFARRMALNIGNLLFDEARLQQTTETLNGAYMIEQLRLALIQKTWTLLCDLDENRANVDKQIKTLIEQTRQIRIERFLSAKDTLIGINAFHNTFDSPTLTWSETPNALGFSYLIFEKLAN